jgi:hypothetical protein
VRRRIAARLGADEVHGHQCQLPVCHLPPRSACLTRASSCRSRGRPAVAATATRKRDHAAAMRTRGKEGATRTTGWEEDVFFQNNPSRSL